MKYSAIILSAILFVAACDNSAPTTSSETFDYAKFTAWPSGAATDVDPNAYGRDNIIFVVDRSGSMSESACGGKGSKSDVIIDAMTTFIPQLPNNVMAGWVDFGNDNVVRVPLGIDNHAALVNAAKSHRPDMGGTYLGAALNTAFDMMSEQALAQAITGTYRIVLIVDGGANDNNALIKVMTKINQTPVEILTAGFCIGQGHTLNQPNDNVYVEASNVDDLIAVMSSAVATESQSFDTSFVTVNH